MTQLTAALSATPVLAIVRLPAPTGIVEALEAFAEGGIRAMEVTLNTPGALDAITAARGRLPDGVLVGAGTVRTTADVARAEAAGAQFLVTPILSTPVLQAATVPVVCGAFTPSEMAAAAHAGAAYVKLFPASALGPGYLREVLTPMPDLRVVPTGGVGIDNVADWARAGAAAVAVGSALADPALVAAGDWPVLTSRARALLAAWPV